MRGKSLFLLFLVIVLFGIFWYWSRPKSSPTTNSTASSNPAVASCPREKVISIDLEKSTYSKTNVTQVVGTIPANLASAHLEYDLVAYKDAPGMINEWDIFTKTGVYGPAQDMHTGWKKATLSQSTPLTMLTVIPQFPPSFASRPYLGIYFRLVCADGSRTPDIRFTRMYIDRHQLDGSLYGVGTSNPNSTKYFK